jgi:hypothetical protein
LRGGGVGSPYAPKVYAFGEVSYPGPESVTQGVGTLTISRSGYYKLTGLGSPYARVMVNPGVVADIVMEDLTLDVSTVSGLQSASAFQIRPGAAVTLRLAGKNFLRAGGDYAAIEVPEGASLTITSAAGDGALSGSLEAISENGGAGIGGGSGKSGGSVTINGGTIHAKSTSAAAIGGGSDSDSGAIVINGGVVSTDTGTSSAGIGGANTGLADVTITGGFVKAAGSANAAGIGSGSAPRGSNVSGDIKIEGGVVTATGGSDGAAIGGGKSGAGGNINVSGGVITAMGGSNGTTSGGAGIGGGNAGTSSTTIGITGGVITAQGGYGSAGIGIGSGSASNGAGDITISGGVVTATGGGSSSITNKTAGAGIGGGYYNAFGNITINGGVIAATGGRSAYTSGSGGAGIGSGAGTEATVGDITISGGIVTAIGSPKEGGNGAAGIGSGNQGKSINSIVISGGVVVASGAGGANTIGGGNGAAFDINTIKLSGGTVFGLNVAPSTSFATNSKINFLNSLVLTETGLLDSSNKLAIYFCSPDHGILMSPDVTYTSATQTFTLNADLTIPNGKTLTIPRGYHVVPSDKIKPVDTGKVIDMNNKAFVAFAADGSWTIDWGTGDKNLDLFSGFYIAPGKTLTISKDYTVTIPADCTATNDGTIVVEAGGTLNVAGTLRNRGLVLNSGGTVNGGTDNRGGFGVGGTLTKDGDTWTVTGAAPLPNGFAISKGQTLVISADATAVVPLGVTLVNDGEITVAKDGTLLVYGTLTNKGTIDSHGTLDNKGTIDNAGTILDNGTFINEQGAVINNSFVTASKDYEGYGEVPFALIHVTEAGEMENYGVVNNSGTLLIDGQFTNAPDGVVNNEPGALIYVTEKGTFLNKGRVNNRGTLNNDGTLINDGTIDCSGGGVFNNSGTVDNSNGTIKGAVDGGGMVIGNVPNDTSDPSDPNNPNASGDVTQDVDPMDIAKGLVTFLDKDMNEFGEARMVLRSDGTYVITAPEGADISNLALSFDLPAGVTAIDPPNGTLRNFSGGPVNYVVYYADGSAKEYSINLRVKGGPRVVGVLIATDPNIWTFSSVDMDGGVSFAIEAPLKDSDAKEVSADMGAVYSDLKFTPTVNTTGSPVAFGTPVLRITGTAAGLAELKLLKISLVEWESDGVEYYQELVEPVTYEALTAPQVADTDGGTKVDENGGGGGGGGCVVGFWPFMAVMFVAGVTAARRKG